LGVAGFGEKSSAAIMVLAQILKFIDANAKLPENLEE
jgi:hypothetical protein